MSPSKVILWALALLILTSIVASLIGLRAPILVLNENQMLYLYSTSAQVLAAVYGLTLTGFIFFRNELSREQFEDDTLAVATESLKSRYFKILIFVTALAIFTFLMVSLAISSENVGRSAVSVIIINVAHSSYFVSLLAIAYFIFDVIAPKRIERESRRIQFRVDAVGADYEKGSLEEFLANYNWIEYILQKYGQAYQTETESISSRYRRISNIRLAEFVFRAEKIDSVLLEKIKNLVTLRNSIIHGAEPVVSRRMVESSEEVLQELASALGVGI